MSQMLSERRGEEIVVNWRIVLVGGVLATVALLGAGSMLIVNSMGQAPRDDVHRALDAPRHARRKLSDMPASPVPARETAEQALPTTPAPEVNRTPPLPMPSRPAPIVVSKVEKPAAVAVAVPAPGKDQARDDEPRPFKRFRDSTEAELTENLCQVAQEVDLDSEKGTVKLLLTQSRQDKPNVDQQPILKLLEQRADLRGLPVRKNDTLTVPKAAKALASHSRQLHNLLYCLEEAREANERARRRPAALSFQSAEVQALHALRGSHLRKPDAVGALVQMLQVEDVECRRIMIELLDTIKGEPANAALAQRAIFDCSPEARHEALRALRSRPPEDVRPQLFAGLRHPWPPAADHAAEAIVHLQDRGAIHHLIDLLDSPPPTAPYQHNNQWEMLELVRVNHLRNCLMCHMPSLDPKDAVRGRIPVPGQPVPSRDEYRQTDGDFVRADVVYLRQDFSVKHQVANPNRWPAMQRFDYLVRRHPLTDDEARLKLKMSRDDGDYPQRQAVLFALRELTGHEATDAAGWRRWLVRQPFAAQSDK